MDALRPFLLEPLPHPNVRLPRRPQLRHCRRRGRQTGLPEQVGAVAHSEAADVRPKADLSAVRRGRLTPLPRQPLVLQLVRAELVQVVEVLRRRLELPDEPTSIASTSSAPAPVARCFARFE